MVTGIIATSRSKLITGNLKPLFSLRSFMGRDWADTLSPHTRGACKCYVEGTSHFSCVRKMREGVSSLSGQYLVELEPRTTE